MRDWAPSVLTSSFAAPTNSYWGTRVKAQPLLQLRPEVVQSYCKVPVVKFQLDEAGGGQSRLAGSTAGRVGLNLHIRCGVVCMLVLLDARQDVRPQLSSALILYKAAAQHKWATG